MLINCVAYHNGEKLADIPVEAIRDYLEKPDCFVWVALRDASPEELAQMQEEFGLHPLAVEDARNGHQRPKLEEYGDSMFAVMHLVEIKDGDLQAGEVAVFVGRNYVLSVRSRSEQDFLGVRARSEREPELLRHGASFVLYALFDAVVDRYFPVIEALESELETVEETLFSKATGSARASIERLYELKRRVTVLRHAVVPLLEATARLHGSRVPPILARSQEYFRDVYDHLARINTSLDAIRETINTAIQVNLSMVAIEDSEVSKRLAAWAGIVAVAMAFAGIWGMNFDGMPELHWEYGYPTALLLMGAVCTALYLRFKRAGWL